MASQSAERWGAKASGERTTMLARLDVSGFTLDAFGFKRADLRPSRRPPELRLTPELLARFLQDWRCVTSGTMYARGKGVPKETEQR